VCGLLLGLCPPVHGAAAAKTVLLLDSYGRNVAPFDTVISVFRTELTAQSPQPVDIQIVSLELARFSRPDQAHLFIDFLKQRYADQPPDLVVSAGGPAAGFVAEHRDLLFPGTPVLTAAVAEQVLAGAARLDNSVVAPLSIDLGGVMENILRLLPETQTVAVVLGTSPLERFWADECRRAFAPFAERVRIEYLDSLAFDAILQRAAARSAGTAIFFGLMIRDQAGTLFDPVEALQRLLEQAKAPVFVLHEGFFGFGAVGGRMISERAAGVHAADIALRLLAGTPAARIEAPPQPPSAPTYDWRALRRWNIDEKRLPPEALVRFRQPTLWEQYGGVMVAGLLLILLQSLLIARLFIQRNRLRAAESDLAQSERRLRRIADALPVLIAQVDNQQRYRFLNEAYQQWFGVRPEEAIGRTIREVIGEPFYAGVVAEVARALAGEQVRFVKEVAPESGKRRIIEALYIPDRGPQIGRAHV
jgi:PAS domain S-box-containing protein